MKHDFQIDPTGDAAAEFVAWFERETTDMLVRSREGGLDGTIFLFVNRAFESHMPEDEIGAVFGRCFARAGFTEEEEDSAFELLEHFAQIAKSVHAGNSQTD